MSDLEIHNPAQLTEDQVVVSRGWRLYTLTEVNGEGPPHPEDLQRWVSTSSGWRDVEPGIGANHALNRTMTFRTKAPMPDGLFVGVRNQAVATSPMATWLARFESPDFDACKSWATEVLRDLANQDTLYVGPPSLLFFTMWFSYVGNSGAPAELRPQWTAFHNAVDAWLASLAPRNIEQSPHEQLCNILSTL